MCSSSSSSNLLVSGPGLSGSELCGVCTGVGHGVDGYLGGDDAGVLNIVAVVMSSRKTSSCFNDNALCSVSSGRIGGTPPKPSKTVCVHKRETNPFETMAKSEFAIARIAERYKNNNNVNMANWFSSSRGRQWM